MLESRCAIDTSALDVFAATAGGLPANEPGVDVALALAVASAALNFAVPRTMAAMGEVGLAGELRAVTGLTRRVREAHAWARRGWWCRVTGSWKTCRASRFFAVATLAEAIEGAQSVTI